jgi:hypothetical protein
VIAQCDVRVTLDAGDGMLVIELNRTEGVVMLRRGDEEKRLTDDSARNVVSKILDLGLACVAAVVDG